MHHHRGASRRRAVCAPRTVRKSITRAPDRSPIERSAMAQSLFFFVRRRMRMPSDAAVLCVGSSPPCALRLVRRPLPLEVPVAWSALASAASMAARLLPLPPPIIARIRQRGSACCALCWVLEPLQPSVPGILEHSSFLLIWHCSIFAYRVQSRERSVSRGSKSARAHAELTMANLAPLRCDCAAAP